MLLEVDLDGVEEWNFLVGWLVGYLLTYSKWGIPFGWPSRHALGWDGTGLLDTTVEQAAEARVGLVNFGIWARAYLPPSWSFSEPETKTGMHLAEPSIFIHSIALSLAHISAKASI